MLDDGKLKEIREGMTAPAFEFEFKGRRFRSSPPDPRHSWDHMRKIELLRSGSAREVADSLRALARKWGRAEGRDDGRLAIADEAADLIDSQATAIAAAVAAEREECAKVANHYSQLPHLPGNVVMIQLQREMAINIELAIRARTLAAGEPE